MTMIAERAVSSRTLRYRSAAPSPQGQRLRQVVRAIGAMIPAAGSRRLVAADVVSALCMSGEDGKRLAPLFIEGSAIKANGTGNFTITLQQDFRWRPDGDAR